MDRFRKEYDRLVNYQGTLCEVKLDRFVFVIRFFFLSFFFSFLFFFHSENELIPKFYYELLFLNDVSRCIFGTVTEWALKHGLPIVTQSNHRSK